MNSIATQSDSAAKGIILVITGLSIAAFAGAIMKLLGDQISPYQVAWFRFAGMAMLLFPYLLWKYGTKTWQPARPLVQMIRGLTMAGATTFFVTGATTVDYADAIAILYAYPFLLVIIAALFLGEKTGWSIWIGVFTGFAGVLLVMRPEFNHVNTGTIYIFICAMIISVQLALNRKLSVISPPLITAFAGAVFATLALTVMLPGNWQTIPDSTWPYIAILVVTGAVNQILLVFAFAYADASTLAPFTYFEIVSAVIFGYLFFGTLPTVVSWAGILLITIGGIYVARVLHLRNISRRVAKI